MSQRELRASGVKYLALIGLGLLALALYGFWFGESGYFATQALARQVVDQERRAAALAQRNDALSVEVVALKEGLDAVERRAREDLGMVAADETFYLVLDPALQ